ncbi:MAG: GntR family transcriptional regulator [Anaerolineaceae bacterium]|nr:GntR family transcriptional regulator [Anaerolineaceae bacterium]
MIGSLDHRSPVPLHTQFKQTLLERFENNEFPLGLPIPAEIDLARDYQISRATVRRAMQEMEHDGYIHRIPGKGTFVLRARIKRGLTRMSSFTEDMRERGQTVTSRVLDSGLKLPPAHISEQFHTQADEQLLYIYRLRLADDLPIVLSISYIHLPVSASIFEEELHACISLWSLLERKGLRPIESDKIIEAVLANEERAALLDVPVGSALLQVEGMAYTIDHIPVEYSQIVSSGERYKYSIHLER